MPRFLLDQSGDRTEWILPDAEGFTLDTRYHDTEAILDGNQKLFNEAPKVFREDGVDFHHCARIPAEVVDMLYRKLGRMPTALELLELSEDRDFRKLKTRNVQLVGASSIGEDL